MDPKKYVLTTYYRKGLLEGENLMFTKSLKQELISYTYILLIIILVKYERVWMGWIDIYLLM